MHNQGITRFVLLKPPVKVLDRHEQEIKLGYKIMLSKARLKNFGDNNLNNVKKIQNILKIRGVKGSVLLDLFPKRGARAPWAPLAMAMLQYRKVVIDSACAYNSSPL